MRVEAPLPLLLRHRLVKSLQHFSKLRKVWVAEIDKLDCPVNKRAVAGQEKLGIENAPVDIEHHTAASLRAERTRLNAAKSDRFASVIDVGAANPVPPLTRTDQSSLGCARIARRSVSSSRVSG